MIVPGIYSDWIGHKPFQAQPIPYLPIESEVAS